MARVTDRLEEIRARLRTLLQTVVERSEVV
jgi:hypothetical protein